MSLNVQWSSASTGTSRKTPDERLRLPSQAGTLQHPARTKTGFAGSGMQLPGTFEKLCT